MRLDFLSSLDGVVRQQITNNRPLLERDNDMNDHGLKAFCLTNIPHFDGIMEWERCVDDTV